MDNRVAVREFLTSRRAKISPERAGLPTGDPLPPTTFGLPPAERAILAALRQAMPLAA